MEETKTNKYGFPIVTCSRCHGTGNFSFNLEDGTTCFKCNGSGHMVAKKALPAWEAFRIAARKMTQKQWGEVELGDVVKYYNKPYEVIALEVADEPINNTDIYTMTATLRINDEVKVISTLSNTYTTLKQTKPLNVTPFLKMIPK